MTHSASSSPITRAIPATGEKLPAVGLGTWQTFDVSGAGERAALVEVLRAFVALGGSVVDSSPMYGRAEGVLGDLSAELSLHERLFVATKVWTRGEPGGVRQMEESIRHLRAKRIDLMQVHNLLDWQRHLPALKAWKSSGRLRYLGITHYHAGAHDELMAVMRTRKFDFVQVNYSLAEREAERGVLPLALELGMAVLINRPFAEGALFQRVKGKPLPGVATELDCASWAQLFLKYLLGHPAVTCVIPATRRVTHLQDNMGAMRGRLPGEPQRRSIAAALASV